MFTTLNAQKVPAIGMGTWMLGNDPARKHDELNALRSGLEAGLRLIDTAEMYGEGRSERLTGELISHYEREDLYLVSKVLPYHAGKETIFKACDASLKRLQSDYLDLYLLHWPGPVPMEETIFCMEELKSRGRIRDWGVSNFDADDMKALFALDGGRLCKTNQVLYNIADRGIEYDLLPLMQAEKMPLMAYSPLAQAGVLNRSIYESPVLKKICRKHAITREELMLAFLLSRDGVLPIPRSASVQHTLENAAALEIRLDAEDLDAIDRVFPPPQEKTPLRVV